MAASPKFVLIGTDCLINSQTLISVCPIGFLNVLPLVFIFDGCASSFLFFKVLILFSIISLFVSLPFKDALKKIKSLLKVVPL